MCQTWLASLQSVHYRGPWWAQLIKIIQGVHSPMVYIILHKKAGTQTVMNVKRVWDDSKILSQIGLWRGYEMTPKCEEGMRWPQDSYSNQNVKRVWDDSQMWRGPTGYEMTSFKSEWEEGKMIPRFQNVRDDPISYLQIWYKLKGPLQQWLTIWGPIIGEKTTPSTDHIWFFLQPCPQSSASANGQWPAQKWQSSHSLLEQTSPRNCPCTSP